MTDRKSESAELDSLQRLLRELPRPPARGEFRERLRDQFVRDALPSSGRIVTRTPWKTPLRLAVAAAAAVVLLVAGVRLNAGPAWQLVASSGPGAAQIDGRAVPLESVAAVARSLKPGSRVRLPEGAQLDLALPGSVLLQIVGGSEVTLPGSPGRWIGRSMNASLDAGELRISTGPEFHGTRFDVITPEARAVVTGTTLAVMRLPDASCICVFEGQVAMLSGGGVDTVRAGHRRSVFRDGSDPLLEPIRPMETMKLSMLRDQAAKGP